MRRFFFWASVSLLALTATGQAQDAPHRGGTLTIMVERDVKSLDPLFGNSVSIDRKFYNLFAESLLVTDESGQPQPNLAASWQYENDGKSLVFHLRHGVTFQDGTPMDAEAVRFNLMRLIDPKWDYQRRSYVAELTSVDVLSDDSVRVNLSKPSAPFLNMMAAESGSIVSPTALKAGADAFAQRPIGTGPFVVESRSDNEVTAHRNPHYWRDGADGKKLPYLDAIHLVINPSEAVRLIQLRSGAAQLSDAVSPRAFAQVVHDPNLAVLDAHLGVIHLLSFNVTRPPFNNPELRKALSLAIDRAIMAKALTQNTGLPLDHGFEPTGSLLYDAGIRGHAFDPAASRALLTKLDFHSPVTLTVIQRDYDVQIAQLIQSMLKQVGVDVHVEVLERLAFLQKVLTWNYDLSLAQDTLQRPDPDTFYTNGYGRAAGINYPGFKDADIFDLVDDAHATLDWAQRRAKYVRIQQDVLDRYYQTPLFWNATKEVASVKLHGIAREGTNVWLYGGMWLSP